MRSSLTSLERLEVQIRALPDGTPQGAAWEEALVRWVNAGGHPDLVKGWGWKQWPGRAKAGLPRIERGVDLIAEDRAGRLVAIQAKFRNDPDSPVKTGEVQKFVGAYRKHFPRRMLISNASSRARGIKEAVGDTEAELVLRTDLNESLFDWIASKHLPRPKVIPLPFQREAAAAIKKHLKDGGRAQIVMACGSGKTYTTLLAMEALGSKRVLVLAPTLLLVKQLRDEWMRERTSTWATLAVCSDIGKDEGEDSTHVSPSELGSKPTTDPAEIADFLKSKGPYVVFGTYASSARIATAQKEAGVPAFDLVVADEAHRIAGAVGKADKDERAQRVVLDEQGIRAERRLFATATPRVYGGDKKNDGEEVVLESMDDPTRFGEEVYKLTFQQAVDLERLVPYKLFVTIVTDEGIAALIHDRKYVDIEGKQIAVDDLATAIAVRRAYKELGISRAISYHGSIKRARAFAQLVQEIKAPGKAPEAECVTGAMPVEDRKEALTRLANAEGPYLITNARCLTEGIDVPALDAVVFADPRRSQVDIVQAVGRAMRKPRGTSSKTTGYIILPVFLSKNDLKNPETAAEASAFAPVLQVLRALKAHDPYRATFFAKILVEQGKRPHKKGKGIDEILEVSIGNELSRELAKRLEKVVQLRAVEVSAGTFESYFLQLKKFIEEHGHSFVRIRGNKLGAWINKIRTNPNALTYEQRGRLNSLGFIWDVYESQFKENLALLAKFVAREGHSRVPFSHVEDGIAIGTWLTRVRRGHTRLSTEHRDALIALGVQWQYFKKQPFTYYLSALEKYLVREGHINVPSKYRDGDGVALGEFISAVRRASHSLDEDQRASLTTMGMVWDAGSKFQDKLDALVAFMNRTGHSNVPAQHFEHGFALGSWVYNIKHGVVILSESEANRLTDAGFTWSEASKEALDFQSLYGALSAFKGKHGHFSIALSYTNDGLPIGRWVNMIRSRPALLQVSERQALDDLGFIWSKTEALNDARFVSIYNNLLAYRGEHGHLRVAVRYGGRSNKRTHHGLGAAVSRLRQDSEWLTSEQRQRLTDIGFVWSDRDARFDRNLDLLRGYKAQFGNCDVPIDYEIDGIKLGIWTSHIRKGGIKLTPEREKNLSDLGFSSLSKSERLFSTKLGLLRQYVAREGHCRVPQAHIEDGVKLGIWVSNLRQGMIKLSDFQIEALNEQSFEWRK